MKKRIINQSLAISFVLLTACGSEKKEDSQNQEQELQETAKSESRVQVIRESDLELRSVTLSQVTTKLPITGRVVPKNTTQLVAEVQGRIIQGSLPFKPGTSFSKGQVILRMDNREFSFNVKAQKSVFLNILTGMMPDLKADYPDNYENWLAYIAKYEVNAPLQELPETMSNEEKYFVTSSQVYNNYYAIKAQEERLSKYTLKAPFPGTLSSALVDAGGLVNPGQPLGTFISDRDFEIETAVSIGLAKNLEIGQKIEFVNDQVNQTFEARVTRINKIVDPTTQNIPVFLSISHENLRSGMYLEGQVPSSIYKNAVRVPANAVYRDNTVHILNEDVILKRKIEVLETGSDQLIITGLKSNDKLVTTYFQNPISGLKITKQ